jgi:guanylate kinase
MNNQGFDSELQTYFGKIKEEIKKEHQEYVVHHPELREILNDFLSSVLLEKPDNVYNYAKEFFSYFNIDKDKIVYKPLIISGPSGAGKVTT